MELSKDNFKSEMNRFRTTFQGEAWELAEKSIRLEKKGSVGIIVFDDPTSKANKLSTPNMFRFFELLCQAEDDKNVRALVMISRKPSIFIAGADIAEIQRLSTGETGAVEALMKLQSVFTYLENLPMPTVCAIHGACLGGGFELALACDYRMVSDAPVTRLGLPEVMLGVIPGWGGTQRLPKLIGLQEALGMILTGKQVDGKKALKLGIADKKAPVEILETKAVHWAEELGRKCLKRQKKSEPLLKFSMEKIPGGKWLIFDQARKQLLSKTKGNYPAPLAALSLIQKTYGGSVSEGLAEEAKTFSELVKTPQCQGLIQVYYLNEGVKKDKGVEGEVTAFPVTRTGVVGAGVMGGGIAQLFAAKSVRVRMKDVNWEAVTKGFSTAHAIFKKQLERKKIRRYELLNGMAFIEGTTSYDGFHHVDLVVEAVIESMEIKKQVFRELDERVRPEAILASNTSSLSITELASVVKDPSRVVGMHFFNPVHKMPLVEIIRGEKTSDQAVAAIFEFSKKLGKTPIVVKDGPGFVVNRILAPYLNEAVHLLEEGVSARHMDDVIERFGMPMGPCTLLDEVGLDVAVKVSKVLFGAFGERMKPPTIFDKVAAEQRFGRKSGRGIYVYDSTGKKKTEDADWLRKLGIDGRGCKVKDDDIVKRLMYLMVNEASRCLEEQLVRQTPDIDVGVIFGLGFAPFRGGLLRYADDLGIEAIVNDLDFLAKTYGERFKPCHYLQNKAVSREKFYL